MPDDLAQSRPINPWVVLATVSIGTLMATIDASSVNVALPTIASEFGITIAQASWISISYFLVITALLLAVGRLSDLTSRRTVFSAGMGLFGLASGLCGLAPDLGTLVAFRCLEAVGGAMIMANSPALIASAFPGARRGRALGTVTLVATVGSSLGPTVGGILTATVGWHGLFFINVPIGLLGVVMGLRVLGRVPQARPSQKTFDLLGALLSALGLGTLVFVLREGLHLPPALAWGLGLGGLLTLGGFLWHEARNQAPLLQPRLFKRRAFASATGSSLLSFCSRAGSFFLMPFFLQHEQGYSPAAVGFMMTSFPIAVALVAPISGALSDRLGTRGLTVAGQLLNASALGLMAFLGADSPLALVLLPQVMLGMGTALFTPPNNNAMLGAVDPEDLGMASGMLAVMRNLGLMLGTGFVSVVLALRATDFMGGFRLALALCCLIALASALVASVRAKGNAVAVPSATRG